MKFTARELVTLEEALRGMNSSLEVERLILRVAREKPRKLASVLPNHKAEKEI